MSRILSLILISMIIAAVAGCEKPVKDDPRFRVDPVMLQQASNEGFAVPDATEVDLVEALAQSRNNYHANLEALKRFYAAQGYTIKLQWVKKEIASLGTMPHYQYLMPAESIQKDRMATDSIEAADILYADARQLYKEAGALIIVVDDEKLRMALNKFNEVIALYPSSDKIDDSAYYAGRIYEHFKDYEIAARYYQRAFQWNDYTPYPARYRAARVLDHKLLMRTEALTLYRLAYQLEARYSENAEYAQQRIMQLTKGQNDEKILNESTAPPIQEEPGDSAEGGTEIK